MLATSIFVGLDIKGVRTDLDGRGDAAGESSGERECLWLAVFKQRAPPSQRLPDFAHNQYYGKSQA